MLLFTCSIVLALGTLLTWFYILRIRLIHAYFLLFPILIIYLCGISFFLSLTASLTSSHFLIIQLLLLIPTLLTAFLHIRSHKFKLTHILSTISYPKHIQCSFPSIILLITILFFLVLSGWLRALTPTLSFDDVAYRASAPMHWIQNQSIFRFPTMVEHKNVFLFGTGILYMWPHLFDAGERVANLLYWTAFPLLLCGMYLLMGKFTHHITFKLGILLLLISAPIIYKNFNSVLIQETWMGVLLVSCFYILIDTLQNKTTVVRTYIFLGFTFGVLPLIKPTGWFYTILLLFFLQKPFRRHIFPIISGFIISIFISGYPSILYQNYQLYGSLSGSPEFTNIHLSSLTPIQFMTHSIRIPFTLIKFPCYTPNCLTSFDIKVQALASYLGATTTLDKEREESWIGTFQYISADPDSNFGFGGIIWFLLLILSLVDTYRMLSKKQTLPLTHQVFLVFSGIILLQLYVARWENASGVPYKHLIGAFAITCVFSYRLFECIWKKKYHVIQSALYILLFISVLPLISTTITSIYAWSMDDNQEAIRTMRTGPNIYASFLSTLPSPTTFLVAEPSAPDYPLFWFQSHQKNIVHLLSRLPESSEEDNLYKIQQLLSQLDIHYVIISGDTQLTNEILNTNPLYAKTSTEFESTPIDIIHVK